jgi:hypothetical protein
MFTINQEALPFPEASSTGLLMMSRLFTQITSRRTASARNQYGKEIKKWGGRLVTKSQRSIEDQVATMERIGMRPGPSQRAQNWMQRIGNSRMTVESSEGWNIR